MSKVTFNGATKVIVIDSGVNSLDVKVDLYSDWKEWVLLSDNSKYLPALRVVGGDEISSGYFLAGTYFLINGWRIRPAEESGTVTVIGNLYVDGSSDSPFIPTLGNYNVMLNLSTSNIVNVVATGSGVTAQDKIDIIDGVEQVLNTNDFDVSTDSKNDIVNNVASDVQTIIDNATFTLSEEDKDDIADKVKTVLDADIQKMLGLLHQNFRLTDQQYNSDGNLITATVYLYGNSADCIDGTNPIGDYTMVATYNAQRKLIDYKMWNN